MSIKTIINPAQVKIENYDLICFSHLRWDFVYQRPQHLISRFAKVYRTFFIEEPVQTTAESHFESRWIDNKLCVVIPRINSAQNEQQAEDEMKALLSDFLESSQIKNSIFWYYTPMSLAYTDHLEPQLIVYDCMDELSAFKFAPPRLRELEQKLFEEADLVFTGGLSLYEHKKNQHKNIYAFPSSIDKEHFAQARKEKVDPEDQAEIPHPRFGFYGVVDERFDIELLDKVAQARPEWHFEILGPVVKIDEATLPRRQNIHYLGSKSYKQLPAYLAGWDIAMIPFARNESTQFISPTKTPEYLAAGKPVISTSIRDVVDPYGTNKLVHIADTAEEFIAAAESILSGTDQSGWLNRVDEFLEDNSWDKTWTSMLRLMQMTIESKPQFNTKKKKEEYV